MAAQAEHFPYALRSACTRESMRLALYAFAAMLVVVVGVLGILRASSARHLVESWINIHVLFGLLLCGFLLARYRWPFTHEPWLLPSDSRELSRHLSRIVYLLLYTIVGVRQSIGLVASLWHGGTIGFNLADEPLRYGADGKVVDTRDFQMFLASALCVLIMIRVFAFRLWLRFKHAVVSS